MKSNLFIAGVTCIGTFFAGVSFSGALESSTWLLWLLIGLTAVVNVGMNLKAVHSAYGWGKLDAYKETRAEKLEWLQRKSA